MNIIPSLWKLPVSEHHLLIGLITDIWLIIEGTGDQQHGMFQKAIHSLPSENYNTLKYLMNHLDR